jgi:hypothetical protein
MSAPQHTALPLRDRYEVAYLAGGQRRLADTAVATLLEAGRIKVRPTGELYAVDLQRAHPIEAAVLDTVGTRGRSLTTVRWRLTQDERIRPVADRLALQGLMTVPGRRGLLRRRTTDGVRTAEGRRVLRQLRAEHAQDFDVALFGPSRMTDTQLRDAVFRVVWPAHTGRPFTGHRADDVGGYAGFFWSPVWGGDGGGSGCWGGDGGGSGGGDGGGGSC